MIFNITYSDKSVEKELNDLIGKPFGLMERIKMRGIGTSKMQIVFSSEGIAKLLQDNLATHYCYLEMRPKGLIVGFQSHLKTYVWAIPYYHLSIYYNSGLLTIFGKSQKIKSKTPV